MRAHIYNKVDEERMRQLLDRFMQGATTLDEEQWLADHLRNSHKEEWAVYREMFAWFDQGMPETQNPEKQARTVPLVRWWRQIAAVAAVVVVVVVGWSVVTKPQPTENNLALTKPAQKTVGGVGPNKETAQTIRTEPTKQTASAGRRHPTIASQCKRNLPTSTVMTEAEPASPLQDEMDEGQIVAELLTEQAQEHEEVRQELRNNFVEAVYTRLPYDNNLRLVMDETGDYQILPTQSPVEL